MKYALPFILFHFLIISSFGQNFSRQEVDSMLYALDESKPDISRIDLLLNLAEFHIFKPGESKTDLDSAEVYITEAKTLNTSLRSADAHGYQLLIQSFLEREKGQKEEAKELNEKAVDLLEKGSNKSYLGLAYYELSWYYDYNKDLEFPEKMRLVKQSVKSFEDGRIVTRKSARALEMLGDLYCNNDEPSKAIEVLKLAEAAYDSVNYPVLQGVYVLLGDAYLDIDDYGQSLFYLLKALKTARAVGDSSMQLCHINHMLSILYDRIGSRDVTIRYAKRALEIARKHKDEYATFFLSVELADAYSLSGKPETALKLIDSIPESHRSSLSDYDKAALMKAYLRIYLSFEQHEKARPLLDTLLATTAWKTVSPRYKRLVHSLATRYYLQTGQLSKARTWLKKNQDPVIRANVRLAPILDSHLWYKLDSAEGNYRSAFNNLLFHKRQMDSVLSENRVRQLQVLGVEYEIALKEDSIKLKDKNIQLLTQQNSLQHARLERATLMRNVTIAGTALAFVIIGLLYGLYRQKQKSAEVITQKGKQLQHFLTEKEWLLKEIHHRVKNNLQFVISLLNSQSAYINSQPALTAIHESQHRVQAIALIHQKLYNAGNVSSIDISVYVRELVSYLADSFNVRQRIRFELAVESLQVDVSQAVPIGLILNEAIIKAIEYAFPDGRPGVISVSLAPTPTTDQFTLTISDNGVGAAHYFDPKTSDALGMNLIAALTDDLEGSFSIEGNNGTAIKVTFVHNKSVSRTVELDSATINRESSI